MDAKGHGVVHLVWEIVSASARNPSEKSTLRYSPYFEATDEKTPPTRLSFWLSGTYLKPKWVSGSAFVVDGPALVGVG